MISIVKFILSERQVWRNEQEQLLYTLAQKTTGLQPYPLNMEPLLSLPHGMLDEYGVPFNAAIKKYPATYHPTTIAQYGLANWNKYLSTEDQKYKEAFILQARWLIAHMVPHIHNTSVWPIPFAAPNYYAPTQWLSAMTQGNVISVLTRAYQVTNEHIYLEIASRAARIFEFDIRDGGVSSFMKESDIFFEEVAVYPAAHILNGYFFALFGLYDYVNICPNTVISSLIHRSLTTLDGLLEKYDTGYWSRYDLLFKKPATRFYHALHITMLEALAQYSGCEYYARVATRWNTYQQSRSAKTRYFVMSRLARYRYGTLRLISRLRTKRADVGLK